MATGYEIAHGHSMTDGCDFETRLRIAANDGLRFDLRTKLPEEWSAVGGLDGVARAALRGLVFETDDLEGTIGEIADREHRIEGAILQTTIV